MLKRRLLLIGLGLIFICGVQSPQVLADTSETDIGATLPLSAGGVHFSGQTSPGALVTFESNNAVMGTQVADGLGNFDMTFPSLLQGLYNFSVFATDSNGYITDNVSEQATIVPAVTIDLGPYFLPPTLHIVTNPIKRPQTEHVIGSTVPAATVTALWSGSRYGDNFSTQANADSIGGWDQTPGQYLHLGTYDISTISNISGGAQSPQTSLQQIQVQLSADLNNDNRVNLTDFSILMFYYNGANLNKPADINDDGHTNLTDFSIMLFYWTG